MFYTSCKSCRKVSKGGLTHLKWSGATDSPSEGSLSLIQLFRWLGRSSKNRVIMKLSSDGSIPNKRLKIFALDGSRGNSIVFSFQKLEDMESTWRMELNPREPSLSIGMILSIGKEMILNEYVDQKVFWTAYRQWVAAKDEQAMNLFSIQPLIDQENLWKGF